MTSTVQDRKPPSAGTKVEPGDAPVVQEGAGKVASESLAAESKSEGGEFASNKGIRSENVSSQSQSSESRSSDSKSSESKSSGLGKSTGSSENTQSKSSRSEQTSGSSAGDAPTYVEALQTDPKGPHGKNLKEAGGDDSKEGGGDESKEEDGLKKALESEPGSENDPSRLAEKKFNQSSGGGPRQTSLDTETKYDALNPEEST